MPFLVLGEVLVDLICERALELGRPVCFDPNPRLERWPSREAALAAARATESWGAVA